MKNITILFITLFLLLVSIAQVESAITDKVVAYWDFDNNTASQVIDSSPNALHGNLYGTTNITGKIGDGRYKSSASNRVVSNTTVILGVNWSWSLWIYPTSYTGGATFIAYRNDGTSGYGYTCDLTVTNGYPHCYIRDGVAWSEITATNNIPLNQWTLLTLSVAGGNWKFYENDTVIGSGSTSVGMSSLLYLVALSGYSNALDGTNIGVIDEVLFLNRTINDSEVATLWNNGNGVTYPFNISTSPIIETYNVSNVANTNNVSLTTLNLTVTTYINSSVRTNLSINATTIIYYRPLTYMNNNCSIFYGSICVNNGQYFNMTMSKVNSSTYNETIAVIYDNELFPAYYPFNFSVIENTPHQNYTNYNNNNIKWNIFNFSNTTNYYINLEFMAINKTGTTGNMLIYYCNSSYINGNPSSSGNCQLVDSFVPQNYNHAHKNYSKHQLIPVNIVSIKKTQLSYFVFVATDNIANGWNFGYVNHSQYNNLSFSIGNYNTWNQTGNTPFIFDMHTHTFNTNTTGGLNDRFQFYTVYNDNNGTTANSSLTTLLYEIAYSPPSAVGFINPDCNNDSTLEFTYGSTNPIIINWTNSSSQLGMNVSYVLYWGSYGDLLGHNDIYTGNNTHFTWNTTSWNSELQPSPQYYFYITAYDGIGEDTSTLQCFINICENSYTKSVQPCIANTKIINYTDTNHCNERLNVPTDEGTYESCSTITYTQKVYPTDIIILAILFLFLIISLVCAIFVHEGFFGMCALLLAVMFAIFLEYDYPDVLNYVVVFMILLFVVMWIVIGRMKRS